MSNLSLDLPVKLEELCKFTFSFSNLIKVINYLHQRNLDLQTELKDMNQRIYSMESIKNDIEDMKIKSLNIQQTNENLNREVLHVKDTISKFNNNFIENNKKHEAFEEKIKELDKEKNAHEKNLNHLNEVVEENIKKTNYLENFANSDTKRIAKLEGKVDSNIKSIEELKGNIKEINTKLDEDNKNFENIDNSIKEVIGKFDKKNLDLNNKLIDIENDVANISEKLNVVNNKSENNKAVENVVKRLSKEIVPSNLPAFNTNMDQGTNDLIKAVLDEVEDQKVKFNKIKEDFKLIKENQSKQNETFKANISKILEDINNIKNDFEENFENMENNINTLSHQKERLYESKEEIIKNSESNQAIEPQNQQQQPDFSFYFSKFVPIESFKKLNDNVRILNSALNTKVNLEDFENKLKKFNSRLEKAEMTIEGQTHGPRPRINLALVNSEIIKENLSEIPSELRGDMEEIEAWAKLIEKRMDKNIQEIVNNEIKKFEKSLEEKNEEIMNNYQKNTRDIEKNNKTIIDIRNILVNLPTKADMNKIKNDQEKISKDCRINRLKIEELLKNIEGDPDDEENEGNTLTGSVFEKMKILNHTCLTLNNKITILENKNKLITKEVKEEVKQNLKIETSKIMQQFKSRLESFTNKFEYELKNKIDQIGLTDFENKINNKFYIDLREKIDKSDLKKNNNLLNRKIDNLETKISKTLVDTIIDLQMDDQPLIIKKNLNGVDVCASCNQPVPKINMSGGGKDFLNGSTTNLNRTKGLNKSLNFTQPINLKSNVSIDKNNKVNVGQNKLPEIIPNIYQK